VALIRSPSSRWLGAFGGFRLTHPRDARPELLPLTWVAVLPLVMMLTSDYKLRLRPPGESLSGRPDATIVVEILAYGAVVAFVLFQIGRPPRLAARPIPLLAAAWAFAITLAATAVYSIYPTTALVRGAQLLVICVVGHAVALYATREHLHRLVHAYVAVVCLSILLGAAFPYPRQERLANRFTWLYVHPVMAATYLGLAVVLVLGLLLRRRRNWPSPTWTNTAYGLLLAGLVGALLATRTRGALAATLAGSFVVAIASVRRKSRLDIVVLSSLVVLIAGMIASQDILGYLARGESSESLRTLTTRTVLWQEAWDLFEVRPVFGYGLTASRGLFFETVGLGGAHNALINVMVDAGLFGVVTLTVLLVTLVRWARAVRWVGPVGDDVPMILGAITFLLVNSFTVEFMAFPGNAANIWLFLLVGWVAVLHRLHAPGARPSGLARGSSLR
jgi:exopolysaccharide production protein ExoQ